MNDPLRVAALLGMSLLAACSLPRPASRPVTHEAGGPTAAQLLVAVQSDADRIDQSADPAARAQLLAAATDSAQRCLDQFAHDAACQYAQAQVLGLMARERPLQAVSLLKQMLASLTTAEGLDPMLDHAGPARLTAVVLMRAPPWPLGPGDADGALVAAQRAMQHDSAYPPNLITLGQAQAKAASAAQARATFAQAQRAVQAWPDSADRTRWQQTIEAGLRDLP